MSNKVIKSKHTDVSPGGSWIYKQDAWILNSTYNLLCFMW
jgi:hypothetical protein